MSKKSLSMGVKVQMVFWALFMPVCLLLAIWAFLPSANKDDGFDAATIQTQGLSNESTGQDQ